MRNKAKEGIKMASNANETIKWRNEGMAYALRIAKEHGLEELEEQVKLRGLLKVSVRFSVDELDKSLHNMGDRIYNNMLTMIYAVLHDDFGFGNIRLHRFKSMFDKKIFLVSHHDPVGRHYAQFFDYAEEANRLYKMGINLDAIRDTQINNEENDRKYVAADETIKFLKHKGFNDAADEFFNFICAPATGKIMDKKGRLIAEARRYWDRRNKFYTDDAYEENVEYWFNIFGLAMHSAGLKAEDISSVWSNADSINGNIAYGDETIGNVKNALLDSIGTMVEFTKGEELYAEDDQEK